MCCPISAECGFYHKSGMIKCYACLWSALAQSWQAIMDLHSNVSVDCPFTKDVAFNQPIMQSKDDKMQKNAKSRTMRNGDPGYVSRLSSFNCWEKENKDKRDANITAVSTVSCAAAGFRWVCPNLFHSCFFVGAFHFSRNQFSFWAVITRLVENGQIVQQISLSII